MPQRQPKPSVTEQTARILYLTYGDDAVEMAQLRCTELDQAGDKEGLAGWRAVLEDVRKLVAGNPAKRGTKH